jgi:hypothetical protein
MVRGMLTLPLFMERAATGEEDALGGYWVPGDSEKSGGRWR